MFVILFIFFAVNLYNGFIEPFFSVDYAAFYYRPAYYDLEHYNQDLIYFDYLISGDPRAYPCPEINPLYWHNPAEPIFGQTEADREFWVAKERVGRARSIYSEVDMVHRIMKLNIYNRKTKKMFTTREITDTTWTKLNEKWMTLWSDLNNFDRETRQSIIIMYVLFKKNGTWDQYVYGMFLERLKLISNKYYWIYKKK